MLCTSDLTPFSSDSTDTGKLVRHRPNCMTIQSIPQRKILNFPLHLPGSQKTGYFHMMTGLPQMQRCLRPQTKCSGLWKMQDNREGCCPLCVGFREFQVLQNPKVLGNSLDLAKGNFWVFGLGMCFYKHLRYFYATFFRSNAFANF
jgi:hypothetical protein